MQERGDVIQTRKNINKFVCAPYILKGNLATGHSKFVVFAVEHQKNHSFAKTHYNLVVLCERTL